MKHRYIINRTNPRAGAVDGSRVGESVGALPPKLVPVVAAVSSKGIMHLPKAVQDGLHLREGEKIVFFVDEGRRRAFVVSETEGFQFPNPE